MLVEFVTSPAGPLLSTGFHFKADSIIDTGNAESIQVCRSISYQILVIFNFMCLSFSLIYS
jgi:hypothetical protein